MGEGVIIMTLDNDIIRDVLLCIERKCECYTNEANRFVYQLQMHWKIVYEDEYLCSLYLMDDIKYCIVKLYEAGLINGNIPGPKSKIIYLDIDGISWEGHEFLKNIRDDNVWKNVKSKIGNLTKISLSVLSEIAVGCATEYYKKQTGLQ